MNSFRFVLIFGLVVITRAQVLIESKLDRKVLTITNKTVPPTGPYQRVGVAALDIDNSHALSQYWALNYLGEGPIAPVDGELLNSLTIYLPCDDCFSYFYTYDYGKNVSDGSRLLRRLDTDTCVKNPGNGGFIMDALCNENDASQLWIVKGDTNTTNVSHDSIEDSSMSSEEEINIGKHKSSSTSEEEVEAWYEDLSSSASEDY